MMMIRRWVMKRGKKRRVPNRNEVMNFFHLFLVGHIDLLDCLEYIN